ncbi:MULTISPECIES: helix-turn-helix transcriptional regulator [Tissierellales]|uniref:helix-turn-helix transcriptional regulator n=1 Tax=Tissierellales TaxID=1737405 RepID=UPI0008A04571|nr:MULTISPECIES: helix-turn-helix transcriptional regulator [Tissierellales]SCL84535.1 Control catabolite protein of gluconeogenesis [Sporanaerobacter sp. PP17-6a]
MVVYIQLNERQEKIIDIVKTSQPITGEAIAKRLKLTRSTLRPDLSILTMSGILDARPKVGYFYTGKTALNFISERIEKIKVSKVKSVPVVVDENTSVYDAIVTLMVEDVGTLFVTSDGFLSGIISRKDFLKNAIGGIDLNRIPVGMIMTRMPNIIVTFSNDSILEAASNIIEHEIDCLPVVEEVRTEKGEKKFKVVGRISKTTITRIFVELGKDI